jgi:hypothetical protein
MHELGDTPESTYGQTPSYKPPVFKKDFFDTLIKNHNKQNHDVESQIDESKDLDPNLVPEKSIFMKILGMFQKVEDLSAAKVIF